MKIKIAFVITLSFILLFALLVKGTNHANGLVGEGDTCPANFTLDASGVCFPTGTGLAGGTIKDVLIKFLYWILGILASLAILTIIISGVQYIVSAGDEKIIETAKRNIKWSIIGLVIALASFAIVYTIDFIFRGSS